MEGINAIMSNCLVKLSEQQLLDCVTCSSDGCEGGRVVPAFRYLHRNGGQVLNDVYPYTAEVNTVHKRVIAPAVSIDGFAFTYGGTEKKLKVAVASQPVVVALGADKAFVEYDGGVVDSKNYTLAELSTIKFRGSYIGHYVTVVGYGITEFGELFWLVKNSRGANYGEDGYIRIARETGKEGGAFGIARFFAYPVKKNGKNNRRCMVRSEAELYGCKCIHWI
ncbi:hypothetical protein CFC21_073393 [Triticum aestivum]|uniref:Peptidase C1A papain C-terminal domain-containing protein n=2 Tax=Triticum aestivum TaxID=4565 RepID=A0A9R1KV36_WHEAT|nr:cysteine proteinase EP-B 2-like [Triticum aestivum]XP_044390316.1 cysteine proteinase EP-B 2-like [Triticum aestivum]XP_044390318.1 cysteine proteinase EP-B 2-like [Triticum aestivum]XP_044390319.1 cysteine proteinase EP-B 2-like [Triticum aestivum]XP_044390320.1 cysteine proteinase EP-B 2-like [Triticum aestivum]XP_044390321.1 cysteine proteinase EP-B 2-like [Triticum aestivum]XP_044390322.1 cysteine proteinase EP-B 2-like [Triticum aestivum]XP_044390323.1 cysteine proteinase EP-B 2-like